MDSLIAHPDTVNGVFTVAPAVGASTVIAGPRSSSAIVIVWPAGLASVAPVAVDSRTVNVSRGSFVVSGRSGTVMYCTSRDAVPLGNVTVPPTRVTSPPSVAVPAVVSYATVTGQPRAAPPGVVSRTPTCTDVCASATVAVAAVTATVGVVAVLRTAPSGRPAAYTEILGPGERPARRQELAQHFAADAACRVGGVPVHSPGRAEARRIVAVARHPDAHAQRRAGRDCRVALHCRRAVSASDDCGHQRLRARRRLRAGAGVRYPHGLRDREVRPARARPGHHPRGRRHPAPARASSGSAGRST